MLKLNYPTHIPFIINNSERHSMSFSLKQYIETKIHEKIILHSKKQIKVHVIGSYCRDPSMISKKEKTDKIFNWQRPTVNFINDEYVELLVYPGRDYVRHYASLLGTWYALNKIDAYVTYELPDESLAWNTIQEHMPVNLTPSDIAIVGYGVDFFSDGMWEGTGPIRWSRQKLGSQWITWIGCEHSIWGDIGGRFFGALAHKGFPKIIYIGKLGTLKETIPPNEYLATGSSSYLDGETITWNNIFDSILSGKEKIVTGKHYNCASVILETKEWVKNNMEHYDFVDPEIGHMAKWTKNFGSHFSYLHIISDNLAKKYREDLSNEREQSVIYKRSTLIKPTLKSVLFKALQNISTNN